MDSMTIECYKSSCPKHGCHHNLEGPFCDEEICIEMKSERPETLNSTTTKVPTGYGNLYITITEHNGKPFEIFCSIGKSGASVMAKAEVTGRLASLSLRNGVPVEDVIKQLIDIAGGEQRAWKHHLIKSIPDAVGRVLSEKYLNKKE